MAVPIRSNTNVKFYKYENSFSKFILFKKNFKGGNLCLDLELQNQS
jgi:hypothetical protein